MIELTSKLKRGGQGRRKRGSFQNNKKSMGYDPTIGNKSFKVYPVKNCSRVTTLTVSDLETNCLIIKKWARKQRLAFKRSLQEECSTMDKIFTSNDEDYLVTALESEDEASQGVEMIDEQVKNTGHGCFSNKAQECYYCLRSNSEMCVTSVMRSASHIFSKKMIDQYDRALDLNRQCAHVIDMDDYIDSVNGMRDLCVVHFNRPDYIRHVRLYFLKVLKRVRKGSDLYLHELYILRNLGICSQGGAMSSLGVPHTMTHTVDHQVLENVELLMSQLNCITDKVNYGIDKIANSADKAVGVINGASATRTAIIALSVAVVLMYVFTSNNSGHMSFIAGAVVGALLGHLISSVSWSDCYTRIMQWLFKFSAPTAVEMQSIDMDASDLSTLVCEVLSLGFFSTRVSYVNGVDKLLQTMNTADRDARTLSSVFTRISDVVVRIVEKICLACGSDFTLSARGAFMHHYTQIDAQIKDIIKLTETCENYINDGHASRISGLIEQINLLLLKIPAKTENSVVRTKLTQSMSILQKMLIRVRMTLQKSAGARFEPFVLHINGTPGCGKTTVITKEMYRLLEIVADDKERENLDEFTKQPYNIIGNSTKHFEGFDPKLPITLINEIFQGVEPKDATAFSRMFIDMVGSNPCPLPMAVAENKGHISFHARMIVCGGNNLKIPRLNGLEDVGHDALLRRMNKCCFRAYVSPECAKTDDKGKFIIVGTRPPGCETWKYNYVLDVTKAEIATRTRNDGTTCMSPYRFIKSDWSTGRVFGQEYTVDGMFEEVRRMYNNHASKQHGLMSTTETARSRYVSQCMTKFKEAAGLTRYNSDASTSSGGSGASVFSHTDELSKGYDFIVPQAFWGERHVRPHDSICELFEMIGDNEVPCPIGSPLEHKICMEMAAGELIDHNGRLCTCGPRVKTLVSRHSSQEILRYQTSIFDSDYEDCTIVDPGEINEPVLPDFCGNAVHATEDDVGFLLESHGEARRHLQDEILFNSHVKMEQRANDISQERVDWDGVSKAPERTVDIWYRDGIKWFSRTLRNISAYLGQHMSAWNDECKSWRYWFADHPIFLIFTVTAGGTLTGSLLYTLILGALTFLFSRGSNQETVDISKDESVCVDQHMDLPADPIDVQTSDTIGMQNIANLIRSNTYKLEFEVPHRQGLLVSTVGYAVFVHGRSFVTCAHVWNTPISKGYDVKEVTAKFYDFDNTLIMQVPYQWFSIRKDYYGRDIAIVTAPRGVREHADLLKYMLDVSESEAIERVRKEHLNGIMVSPSGDKKAVYSFIGGTFIPTAQIPQTLSATIIDTISGDCGLPNLISDDGLKKMGKTEYVFVSIHFGRQTLAQRALSNMVFRNMFKHLPVSSVNLSPLDALKLNIETQSNALGIKNEYDIRTTNVKPQDVGLEQPIIGEIVPPLKIVMVSDYMRAPLYQVANEKLKTDYDIDVIGLKTPVNFKTPDGEMPLTIQGMAKYGTNVKVVSDPVLLRTIVQILSDRVLKAMKYRTVVPRLDYEDIIDAGELQALDLSKAAGPSLKMLDIRRCEIFKRGGTTPLAVQFFDALREQERCFVESISDPVMFVQQSLKSELRVRGKKPRSFFCQDTSYHLMCKKYLGHFVRDIPNLDLKCAVGMNVYSSAGEVFRLFDTDKTIVGDHEKYDKLLLASVMMSLEPIIDAYYEHTEMNTSHDKFMRSKLMYSMVHWVAAVNDHSKTYLVEVLGGMASGDLRTATFNSLYQYVVTLYIMGTWCKSRMTTVNADVLRTIVDQVDAMFYGDDFIISVSRCPTLKGFDFYSLKQGYADNFGTTITTSKKDGSESSYQSLRDEMWLGRHFIRHENGLITLALKMQSIFGCLYFKRRGLLQTEYIQIIESALQELAQHGRKVFDDLAPFIIRCVRTKLSVVLINEDFDVALTNCLSRGAEEAWACQSVEFTKPSQEVKDRPCDPLDVDTERTSDVGDNSIILQSNKASFAKSFNSFSIDEIFYLPHSASVRNPCLQVVSTQRVMSITKHIQLQSGVTERASDFVKHNDQGLSAVSNEVCVTDGTTCFIENGAVVHPDIHVPDLPVYRDATVIAIGEFLRKPLFLSNVAWATSMADGSLLATSINPATLLAPGTAWGEKLKGFLYMKGTFVMTIELNASPFMAGALMSYFRPHTSGRSKPNNLVNAFQLPHVFYDTRSTSAVLKVPLVSPFGLYSNTTATATQSVWGTVDTIIASALTVGAGATYTNLDVSFYGHWEDVELYTPIIPQSNRHERYVPSKPISSGLKTVSKVAGVVKDVPIISAIAGPVEWAANLGAGVAAALGFSKPILDVSPELMVPRNNPYAHIAEGPNTAVSMASISQPEKRHDGECVSTDEDEMSLNFLCRLPNFQSTIEWTGAVASGSAIYTQRITPSLMYNTACGTSVTVGATTIPLYHGGPLFYLSSIFKLWRGSVNMHIKFIKTAFHTGRLQLVWTPYETYVSNGPTLANSLYAYRKIIDVRDQDEIIVNLPYLLRQEYLRTGYDATSSGSVSIIVLNELRAPDTCAQKISMLISFTGGPDFEFQAPGHTINEPVMLQSGEMVHYFPNARTEKDLMPSQRCISESITSLKQLISKASPITTSSPSLSAGYQMMIDPYIIGTCYINNARTGYYRGTLDAFSYIGLLYAYQSGSVNIHARTTSSANGAITASMDPGALGFYYQGWEGFTAPLIIGFASTSGSFTPGTTPFIWDVSYGNAANSSATVTPYKFNKNLPVGTTIASSPECFAPAIIGSASSYHVPYIAQYSDSFVVPTEADGVTAAVDGSLPPYADMNFPYPAGCLILSYPGAGYGGINTVTFARSAGDDFRFKFFTGTPYLNTGGYITSP